MAELRSGATAAALKKKTRRGGKAHKKKQTPAAPDATDIESELAALEISCAAGDA